MATNRNSEILSILSNSSQLSSKEIHDKLESNISYATVKRALTNLIKENLIEVEGKGKGTKYKLSPSYQIFQPINLDTYFAKEIDDREIQEAFNLWLIPHLLPNLTLFTEDELSKLNKLQDKYKKNIANLNKDEYARELERLAIDLSWKSSQIEGNTYTLLETERLLKEKETAEGKSKDEAIMLLNHKDAIDFIVSNPSYIDPIRLSSIEDIHSLLVKELGVDRNIRKRRVGITGTNYRPLDNEFQIREVMEQMCNLVNSREEVFEKALLLLVLISYIQGFNDGNKRTARIISNALLINKDYCPISFRTIDSIDYKKAMLLFYEQNNLTAFKRIFINQFEFAVNTYF